MLGVGRDAAEEAHGAKRRGGERERQSTLPSGAVVALISGEKRRP